METGTLGNTKLNTLTPQNPLQDRLDEAEAYIALLERDLESANSRRKKHFAELSLLKSQYTVVSRRIHRLRSLLQFIDRETLEDMRSSAMYSYLLNLGRNEQKRRRARKNGLRRKALVAGFVKSEF